MSADEKLWVSAESSIGHRAAGSAHRPLALAVLGLFLIISLLYNWSVPLFEAPDELQHAAFIVWLADGYGLPIVDAQAPGPWEQEGTQPPLYYWFVASLLGWVPHEEADNLAQLNPSATIGKPLRLDNKNRVLHDWEVERWPFGKAGAKAGSVWFVHLARGISSLMALATLVAVYHLGRTTFPERPSIALGMLVLVAFLPQFVYLSSSINNDNLIIMLSSWVLVLLASWLARAQLPGLIALAGLGTLLGLAALSKFSGLLLWPLAASTLAWLAWRTKRLRWLLSAVAVVFGIAVTLCFWWFLRNQQLYGDLSGLSTHLSAIGRRQRFPSSFAAQLAEFRGLRYSFWGLFGWFNILMPETFYWILDAVALLGVAGFGLFLARSRKQQPAWRFQVLGILVAWVALVAVALLRWTLLTSASQGRLLFPALGAISLILIIGCAEWVPHRARHRVAAVALAGWATCAVLAPLVVIRPAYALPERAEALEALSVVPAATNVRYGDCCELVGAVPFGTPVDAGNLVPLTLVWRALQPTQDNYTLFVRAVTANGKQVGQVDTHPGGGMYPTSQWQPGEYIADTVYIPISRKAEGPTLLRFNVGLYDRTSGRELPEYAADGQPLEVVWAGEVGLQPPQWPTQQSDSPVSAQFGTQIRLIDMEVSSSRVRPGDIVTVTLQWEAQARVTEDYTGFVHLVNSAGRDVAQDDHMPLDGHYPTRVWFPGTVVSDAYRLQLPPDLEEGAYALWGGLYRSDSGQRLPVVSPQTGEEWKDNLVPLGSLRVVDLP